MPNLALPRQPAWMKWEGVANSVAPLAALLMRRSLVIVDFGKYDATNELVALGDNLAPLMRQKHDDKMGKVGLVPISASGGYYVDSVRRPQNTPSVQSPHVDGCFLAQPPLVVALHCLEPAIRGGASTFVYARDIWQSLIASFTKEELVPLFGPEAYKIVRGETALTRRLLEARSSSEGVKICLYFSHHEFNVAQPSLEAAKAFDFIRKYVNQEVHRLTLRLEAGQCAFLVNPEVLHGRLAWSDAPGHIRTLIRAWYGPKGGMLSNYVPGFAADRTGMEIINLAINRFSSVCADRRRDNESRKD
jgi:alpha-ketoglutarate-dependent taurine dioxygenase